MKAIALSLLIPAFALAGCVETTPTQNTVLGTVGGAAVGAAVSSKGDMGKGALIGAAVGAVAGTYLGQTSTPGQCYYRNSAGQRYVAAC
ncbi:YMGG-like glycine zipper-containing protein [Pseudogemmobacter faecipullorum]|uniref:Glycine zipper 2TM domain-containing protein n=1 Tax=Pseudogemmobacter faecipullorum TaxID=2755041 RepID=A0ABS8CPA9_9RHOB|nr:YMGG-like glycine zipper-containing protein [Pseudogemmobacter faecipullorum]MCB5411209.1 glycine zipper 2TM domain-containing protein [Pseudogemmobacter faecipullorum]